MAWVRLDDQFFYHAKVTELSDPACLLYLVAIAHSNAALTDGKLTPARLHICAAARGLADEQALAAELVAAGLWERVRGGWCIHDYARYQPTSTVIKKRRATDAQRQAERRERKRAEAEAADADYVERHAVTHAGQTESVQRESVAPNPNPNPNPPLVNAPLPPTPVASEPPEARAPEPRPIRPTPKPKDMERAQLEAHPLYAPLVTLFGQPAPHELDAWRGQLTALADMGAVPEQVPRAAVAYRRIMGTDNGRPIVLSLRALVKHWRTCSTAQDEAPSRVTVDGRMPIHGELDPDKYTGDGIYARRQRDWDDDLSLEELEREMLTHDDDVTRHAATP